MPIAITLPDRTHTTFASAASRLSSRKLLDIATDVALTKNNTAVQSAILELQERKHYLRELEAEDLLIRS